MNGKNEVEIVGCVILDRSVEWVGELFFSLFSENRRSVVFRRVPRGGTRIKEASWSLGVVDSDPKQRSNTPVRYFVSFNFVEVETPILHAAAFDLAPPKFS